MVAENIQLICHFFKLNYLPKSRPLYLFFGSSKYTITTLVDNRMTNDSPSLSAASTAPLTCMSMFGNQTVDWFSNGGDVAGLSTFTVSDFLKCSHGVQVRGVCGGHWLMSVNLGRKVIKVTDFFVLWVVVINWWWMLRFICTSNQNFKYKY